ncbi:glycosyltransferase [Neobacillus sp. KR4-4]|uniref:glycosyltransferase n=1 Tax=Neobacillus sp. KR4-4 TaxID=3344872 RepID=UPI0035CA3960
MGINVSIIVPVYNAEKYIAHCIESLINQKLEACEFIFINDGSSDNSVAIINEYKKSDNRIKLFNQENQGVSAARNAGLNAAVGDYIGFVDADDFVENEMYKVLYDLAIQGNCDIVISNFQSKMEGHHVISNYHFPKNINLNAEYVQQTLIPYFLKKDDLNTVCTKIYKRDLITHAHAFFPQNLALGEDGLFNMQCFSFAKAVRFIDYAGYHYREVEGSATRNIAKKDYFSQAIEVYNRMLPEEFVTNMDLQTIKKLQSIKLMDCVMAYLYIYFKPTKELSFIKRYQYIKNMINNQFVREALPRYKMEMLPKFGRYEKIVISMIERRSILGLYCATAYSRFRNSCIGGEEG